MKRILAAIAGLALMVAACTSGPASSGVATLPSPSGGSGAAASTSPTPAASGQVAQALAYAHCMRTHGVPTWPDPGSDGTFDKSQIKQAVPNFTPQVDAAETACQDLLPTNGQAPTTADLPQEWTDARDLAQCLRTHGVPNAPDPVADPQHPERPYFDLHGTTIDPNSPQVLAAVQACQSQLHLASLPPTSGGAGP